MITDITTHKPEPILPGEQLELFNRNTDVKRTIKVLESALNNIEQKTDKNIDKKQVKIIEASASKGPVLKRFKPRAQGRAFAIRKPTCHIKIKIQLLSGITSFAKTSLNLLRKKCLVNTI